jgi:flavin reductase (DIM6/NTAB) family NADH-FMN oxidoreductase RutF
MHEPRFRPVDDERAAAGTQIANRATPLVIVSAYDGGSRAGCLVSFHTHVSISPHRYLVCLARPNHTSRVAEGAGHLAVHFLSRGDLELARFFGGVSGDDIDKFAAHGWRPWDDGTPLLDDVADRIVGRIEDRTRFGDHVGYLLDITASSMPSGQPPLTLDRLGPLVPGHPL